jgi:hypothetical protein
VSNYSCATLYRDGVSDADGTETKEYVAKPENISTVLLCAGSQELSQLYVRNGLTVEWQLNGVGGELSCYAPLINSVLREQKARDIQMFLKTVWNINHGYVTFFCQRLFQEPS